MSRSLDLVCDNCGHHFTAQADYSCPACRSVNVRNTACPPFEPGDEIRRRGTTLTGSFLKRHPIWPDYIMVRCPGGYIRVEPGRDWERI